MRRAYMLTNLQVVSCMGGGLINPVKAQALPVPADLTPGKSKWRVVDPQGALNNQPECNRSITDEYRRVLVIKQRTGYSDYRYNRQTSRGRSPATLPYQHSDHFTVGYGGLNGGLKQL